MNAKKEIEKIIMSMSGKYAQYNIFSDWVEMSALSIQNSVTILHGKDWEEREQKYCDIARKYSEHELIKITEMFGLLCDALEEDLTDVLGQVYMELNMGSKYTGQFFTPFHLSELSARMGLVNLRQNEKNDEAERFTINEPSCGSGGMIIAACKILKEKGINYQKKLDVVAQDLDWKGVYMTYLQLSLIGCRAIVVQGDTLRDPYTKRYPSRRTMRTPAMMGVLV